ncbi:replication initiator protein A [Deinococcus sp. Leaf326]|uniref:replication initiator protein A n=1 Tax=Deinococcus sp. Leaf326 TaxID=1736338 RepID=UPI000AAB9257|nr:replication initiator protein A [Deinococcus sp. Leaf326]
MGPKHLGTEHERRDERNIARLGIISIQSRVDDALTLWNVEFAIDGRPYRVECAAPYGRPHGIDTDIILAIQTLFFRSGCPSHNWLHTTAYEVRSVAGLPDNGRTYQRLKEGLKRLWGTGFVVGEGWYDAQRDRQVWSTDTLRYIERIRYHEVDAEPEQLPGLDPSATLSIHLGEQLATSIRARHLQVLDGGLLIQLEQPPARALYRLLEAHRTGPQERRQMTLRVNLEDWRLACGIQSERPELVRRALAPAHEELRAINYLADVQIIGRGRKQEIEYSFAELNAPDPAMVELLIGIGLSRVSATSLAADHGERVETAVAFVRSRQATAKVKNPAGLAVDFLKHEEKYILPANLSASVPPASHGEARLQLQVEEEATVRATDERRQHVRTLAPDAQYDAVAPALRIMLRPLGKGLPTVLEARCRSGELSAADLSEQAARANEEIRMQAFIDDLRTRLSS